MQCPQTEEGLLELVVALSHYTEEGYALFPQVILCDDLSATLRLLQCSDPLHIDTGPREPQTMTQALKRCAPLARGGWVVYMQRFEDYIEYGVFRAPSLPTATAYGHLLAGMLSSDGIVLLDSECKLLGYNLFVRDDEQNTSSPSQVVGGARRRAYMKLRQLIDRGTLQACFICSSDGGTEFYKRGTP